MKENLPESRENLRNKLFFIRLSTTWCNIPTRLFLFLFRDSSVARRVLHLPALQNTPVSKQCSTDRE